MFKWFYNQFRILALSALTLSFFYLIPTQAISAQAKLAWDPNDPAPEGYSIYQRTEGQAYDYSQPSWTGAENTGTVYDLANGTTYYFTVRAYAGTEESADSNEVSFYSSSPTIPTYTISVTGSNYGGISPENTVTVDEGDSQTFIISPDAGYHVAELFVDGISIGAVNTYTFAQVTADHTISANFDINTYTISASAGTNGNISPEGNMNIDHGANQSYMITPDAGYHVADVKVDGVSKGSISSYTFNQVTANRSIEASFSDDTYTIPQTAQATLAWDPNDPAPDGYRIYQRVEGQAYDYSQPSWTGAGTAGTVYNLDYDTSYYFVVRAYAGGAESTDSNEVSFFAQSPAPATQTITVVANGNGTVSPGGTITVDRGSDQIFTISPDTGYHVADVKVDGVSIGVLSSYTFNQVTANHTLAVSYAIDSYTVTASAGTNGTITPTGSVSVDHGTTQTYTITPDTGFHVSDVKVDGASIGAVPSYTFSQISANHTISASFDIDTYTISATVGANGSITPSGVVNVDCGASVTYAITPDAGYSVSDVTMDGASIGAVNSCTIDNVTCDHTLNATFEPDTFTITATAGVNGTITPAGSVDVSYGENQAFSFTADPGFHISDVQVDGQSIGAIENYTFTDLTTDQTITVSFSENSLAKIWIEAEEGDLQLPIEIADDENAGAGGFIWAPSGAGDLNGSSENSGYAEYHFEVPESGDYVVWGRQISNDTSSDSFFVSIDGQAEMIWHTKIGGQDVWTWDVVSIRNFDDPRNPDNPELFRLAAGAHTLRISQREDGTKLDRILITNQTDLTDPEPDGVMEAMAFGDVQINHNWTRVAFEKPFVNPVVVAGPISFNGSDPAVVRIQNVDATGFEIRLQEWEYLDGWHTIETVSYLVMEQGTYTLEDGTKIEAATIETSAAASFKQIAFNEAFNVPPIVMTSVASFNDSVAVTDRTKLITADGFKHRMQEQEANTQDHGTEKLAYIAWEPSSGTVGGTTYVVEKTADSVTHNTFSMMFTEPLTSAPVLLADMQTTDGGDTGNLRCKNRGEFSVDVFIDEEQSKDTEGWHTTEVVGVMAFSR